MKNYSIAIATFYPGDIINKCLASLPNDKEILIIDNGDDKKLRENLSKIKKKISYYNIGDVGISKSLNFAVSKSSNDYIFITQPDVIVSSQSIENLIKASEKYDNIGIASPLTFDDESYSKYDHYDLQFSKKGKVINNKKKKKKLFKPVGDICVEAINSTALLVRKDVIEKIGKWDENIYTYLEDIDLCLRLRLAGYQIIKVFDANAKHIGFASHEKKNHKKHDILRNWHFCWSSIYFKRKHSTNLDFLIFYIILFTKCFFKSLVYFLLLNKKKFNINQIKLRACLSYLLFRKSSFRKKI